jgi:uncharacterized protein YbjQ (UPF0145 family)
MAGKWRLAPGMACRRLGMPDEKSTDEEQTMIQTTTPAIEGKQIRNYHGVVTGEAILGANIFKDMFASIRDIVGGRSAAYEKELQKARTIAFEEMSRQALDSGANAIVGIDIDYETVGAQGGMLMVSVSGTAVTVK